MTRCKDQDVSALCLPDSWMSLHIPEAIIKQTQLSLDARYVYAIIAHYSTFNNEAIPSNEMIAEATASKIEEIDEGINELTKKGYLYFVNLN